MRRPPPCCVSCLRTVSSRLDTESRDSATLFSMEHSCPVHRLTRRFWQQWTVKELERPFWWHLPTNQRTTRSPKLMAMTNATISHSTWLLVHSFIWKHLLSGWVRYGTLFATVFHWTSQIEPHKYLISLQKENFHVVFSWMEAFHLVYDRLEICDFM